MAALTCGNIGRRRSIALQGLGRDDLRVVPFVRAQTAAIKMREGRALACRKLGSHRQPIQHVRSHAYTFSGIYCSAKAVWAKMRAGCPGCC